jgi:hypothetical protein
MASNWQETRFELDRRELLALCTPGALTLACAAGELWITFDGRREDVILRAGASLEVADGNGIVVSALRPAILLLGSSRSPGACLLDTGRGIWTAVRRLRWRFPALSSLPSTQLR